MTEQVEVSSAVYIPDDHPVSTRKRSISPSPRLEPKKPRIDTTQVVPAPEADIHVARRSSRPWADASREKGRGRRLFGAALGALNQRSTSTERRRAQIERKQRDKLKEQAEENFGSNRDRVIKTQSFMGRVHAVKATELLDAHQSPNHHLHLAHFLRTRSRPQVFYLPLKLRPHETKTVEMQIEEAKSAIDKQNEVSIIHICSDFNASSGSAAHEVPTARAVEPPSPRDSISSHRTNDQGIDYTVTHDQFREIVDDNEELQAGVGEDAVIY